MFYDPAEEAAPVVWAEYNPQLVRELVVREEYSSEIGCYRINVGIVISIIILFPEGVSAMKL